MPLHDDPTVDPDRTVWALPDDPEDEGPVGWPQDASARDLGLR